MRNIFVNIVIKVLLCFSYIFKNYPLICILNIHDLSNSYKYRIIHKKKKNRSWFLSSWWWNDHFCLFLFKNYKKFNNNIFDLLFVNNLSDSYLKLYINKIKTNENIRIKLKFKKLKFTIFWVLKHIILDQLIN